MIFRRNVLSHRTEKKRMGSILCFRKNQVSRKIRVKEREREGCGLSPFQSKLFRLNEPKQFGDEYFCTSEKFWYQKTLRIRVVGHVTKFCTKFCVTVLKKNVGEPSCVSENIWYRKTLRVKERGGGLSLFSVENDSSHRTETFSRRTILRFRKPL